MLEAKEAVRGQGWLLAGLSGLLSAIALSLVDDSWFAPTLAVTSAVAAGVGLHRFGRSGRPRLTETPGPDA